MQAILRVDRKAVSPVVAEILLVAIVVVLAAVVYLMASGLLSGPSTSKPFVAFQPYTYNGSGIPGRVNCTITVAAVSKDYSYGNYKANLAVNGTTGTAVAVGGNGVTVTVVVGLVPYRITWRDIGGDGYVNGGDTFLVTGGGVPLPKATQFTFYVLWSDGSSVGAIGFPTP